jgi:hypothetical protein
MDVYFNNKNGRALQVKILKLLCFHIRIIPTNKPNNKPVLYLSI